MEATACTTENLQNNSVTAIVTAMTDNEKHFLPQALYAVLSDEHIDQVIVCFDEKNKSLQSSIRSNFKDARIELLPLPFMNIGAVRNRAIQSVKHSWLAFCDGDDVWMQNKTSQQLQYANKSNLDFVGTGHYLTNEAGQIQTHGLSIFIPMPSSWLVKTEVMKLFPFNESLNRRSDGDWWIRTHEKINKGKYPKILLKYRVRFQSVSMLSRSKKRKVLITQLAQLPLIGQLVKFSTFIIWQSTKRLNYLWLRKWEKQV
ncbi:MAG: glycosyltransferase [Cytophaga sp.]|uniref:glycosyltransferase n=1 Tax=Cytophaga sp. TaxID=29535 RepID=UPI003F7D9DB2